MPFGRYSCEMPYIARRSSFGFPQFVYFAETLQQARLRVSVYLPGLNAEPGTSCLLEPPSLLACPLPLACRPVQRAQASSCSSFFFPCSSCAPATHARARLQIKTRNILISFPSGLLNTAVSLFIQRWLDVFWMPHARAIQTNRIDWRK